MVNLYIIDYLKEVIDDDVEPYSVYLETYQTSLVWVEDSEEDEFKNGISEDAPFTQCEKVLSVRYDHEIEMIRDACIKYLNQPNKRH